MKKDLSGFRFGRLVVVSDSGERNQRAVMWSCICDCGSQTKVKSQLLTRGVTKSCGCLQRQLLGDKKFVDHSGKKFGKLTVVSLFARGKHGASMYARWNCVCECGTKKVIRSNSLTQGEVISCGCAKLGPKVATRGAGVRSKALSRESARRSMKVSAGGFFTPDQITDLYLKQRGCCANCGVKLGDKYHRDHKVALADGGTNDISNIELLCQPCNQRKHAKDPIKWANENGRLL